MVEVPLLSDGLTRLELDRFQQSFAAWSPASQASLVPFSRDSPWVRPPEGRTSWFRGFGTGSLKEADFRRRPSDPIGHVARPFLLELEVELSRLQAQGLWQDLAHEGELRYEQALMVYCKMKETPLFRRAFGGARGGLRPPCLGLGLPLAEAQEFLAAEGLPEAVPGPRIGSRFGSI